MPADAIGALDATEPNYVRRPYAGAHAYLSRHGELRLDGAPVALAAVTARGRRLAALSQAEVLERVRLAVAPEQSPDAFVLGHVLDASLRQRRTEMLHDGSRARSGCAWVYARSGDTYSDERDDEASGGRSSGA